MSMLDKEREMKLRNSL